MEFEKVMKIEWENVERIGKSGGYRDRVEIIDKDLNINFKAEEIGIYLAQILVSLDNTFPKSISYEERWKNIKSILKFISNPANSNLFNFLIFPENTVPFKFVKEFMNYIKYEFPINTITIFGCELISVKECKNFIEKNKIINKEPKNILQDFDKDRLVNPCLIIVKSDKNNCTNYIQLKLTHSKFEGALDKINNLLNSNYIYYFKNNTLNFIVLICSDYFNRPSGSFKRIIDEIDYKILKKGLPLEFIFNIQQNPSPDHNVFLQSLKRIYDDGYKNHGKLCNILLNSIFSENKYGGLSKILFYKDLKLPIKQPIKQIDAPTVGYELPSTEMLMHLHFERLPKSWDSIRDFYPLHYECYKKTNGKWTSYKGEEQIRYIAPMEKETFLGFKTYRELSYKLSSLGNFDKSIEWEERVLKHWEEQKNHHEAALSRLYIAKQYRHQGKFSDSLENYAQAEIHILRNNKKTFDSEITKWRIKAGRIMVEQYLKEGNCKKAFHEYANIIKEIDNYLKAAKEINKTQKKKIKLFKTHAIRQQAEMQRLLGNYNISQKLFERTYKQYNYMHAEEKAYAALGQGDSYRMIGNFNEAKKKYIEVEEYAREKSNKRLLSRVLRNLAEIYRFENKSGIEDIIEELKKLSDEINYLFGEIYYFLIRGGISIKEKDIKKSEEFFRIANQKTKIKGEYLNIEYAHSVFGLAETERIQKRGKSTSYDKAYKLYEKTGIQWGLLRTAIGIFLTGGQKDRVSKLIKNLNIYSGIDNDLVKKFYNNELRENYILFLNIP